jgi:predicted lipoprotein with Yx(FWY)xxD motif
MVANLSREEERRGWRKLTLWGLVAAVILAIVAIFATPLTSWLSLNDTGQDRIATPFPREPDKAIEPAQVETKSSGALGPYLADGYGRTLYVFADDERGSAGQAPESKCYDDCAKSWPPLVSAGAPQAKSGANADLLSTMDRKDGSKQVTYNGWPLYRFVRDVGPEKATGQALEDFGAKWHLISPAGETIEVAPGG